MKQGPLPGIKVFSLTHSHHKWREAERKVKGSEILFLSSFKEIKVHRREVPMKKGRSIPMEKDTHCLFIIYENHKFQDPVSII